MKTSFRLALLPAILFILLDACTLQDHQPPGQNPDCNLLTMTLVTKTSFGPRLQKDEILEVDGQQIPIGKERSYEYTFDEQNRLVQRQYLTYTGSSANQRITYEYDANSVTTKQYNYASPQPDLVERLPLNEQGLWAKEDFTYDADGFLVQDANVYGPTSYTVVEGNITRMERRSGPDEPVTEVVTYEYDLSKPNLPNSEPYRGKISRNLRTKQTFQLYDNGKLTVTYVYNFKYLFDQAGRVTRSYYSFDS
ncbi:hypothetical protein [Larkinella arboricola]